MSFFKAFRLAEWHMQNIVLMQIMLKRHQHFISSKDPEDLVMLLCGEKDGGRMRVPCIQD